jgi:glycogen(starch) synthase
VNVLRLCSVFEPDPATLGAAAFDPIGGMQNHTAALTRALDRVGVRQLVVTSRLGGPTGCRPFGAAATVCRRGVPVRQLRQLWAADAARRLTLGRPGPFDVVHAHQGEDVALLPLAVAAARRFRCPLVVTVHCSVRHTLEPVTPRNRAVKALGSPVEGWALGRADRIITLTRAAAERLVDDGVEAELVSVIPSGFEAPLFDAAVGGPGVGQDGHDMGQDGHDVGQDGRDGRDGGDGQHAQGWRSGPGRSGGAPELAGLTRPLIGYVGRLAPQKDVVNLVQAFPLLATPGASLAIVGDGPDRALVERAVVATGVGDRVRMTGFVAHDRVPAILGELDVLVLPSRYEELGSVLVEGLRAGRPIVASAVGGIPEVVRPGETGLLVPPGEPAALAAAVDRVLTEPGLAATLAVGARRAAAGYHWDELARSVLSAYRAAARVAGRAPVS